MTKSLKLFVAMLAITSTASVSTAQLSASDIANAANQSRSDADAAATKRGIEIGRLMNESGRLQGQIEQLESSLGRQKTVRNVTIVVSVGLAVASGLLIRKGSRGDLGDLAVGMFYGLPAGGLSAVAAITAGGQQVAITVDSNKLKDLKTQLRDTSAKLASEQAGLK